MKKLLLSISLTLFMAIIARSQDRNEYPVFVLNDTFLHAQPKGSTIKPQNYQLSSRDGFKFNSANYDFSVIRKMNEGKNPDAIFIVARSGNYFVELNTNGETIVDASTMNSLDNPKKKFKKFEKGDTPIFGIGTLAIKDGKANMMTFWVSMIDVK